ASRVTTTTTAPGPFRLSIHCAISGSTTPARLAAVSASGACAGDEPATAQNAAIPRATAKALRRDSTTPSVCIEQDTREDLAQNSTGRNRLINLVVVAGADGEREVEPWEDIKALTSVADGTNPALSP